MSVKKYLLTPGPAEVPESVLRAEAKPLISHRSSEFSRLFESIEEKLAKLLKLKDGSNPVVILPSSGTGALECAAVNFLSRGDRFISASCGVFGDRFREIALNTGAECIPIDVPMASAPTPESVAEAVRKNPDARALLITHNETSTGVTVPLQEILAALSAAPSARPLVIVDGVSSVGAIPCFPEDWGIDILCTASQKGLLTPPGLSFVWLSKRALAELDKRTSPSYYFDLKRQLSFIDAEKNSYFNPYTPPVSLFFALDAALGVILDAGADEWFKRRREFADEFAKGLEALGCELFVKDKALRSAGLTAFTVPGDNEAFRRRLSDLGFEAGGGMGKMKGKITRAAHYSDWGEEDLRNILKGVDAALKV